MIDPAAALGAFGALVVLALVLLWPGRGLVARVARLRRSTERVLLEDALKHVYTCESVGRMPSIESLAGQLGVSTGHAARLLAKLVESDLVRSGADGPSLTDQGRSSALQLVRTHRLWERYLADRTSLPPAEWHAEAEHMEHALSPEETERLSSRLGHPRWDPHGDPIPTATGALPSLDEHTLAAVDPGSAVEVFHLEDEPREIYEALTREGLTPGALLEVVDRTAQEVRVRAGGRTWPLSTVAARNVSVRLLEPGEDVDRPVETLRDLAPGEAAFVVDLSPACRGAQRRRLLDLGVVRGTRVTAEMASAFGDPVAYRIRDALVALRGEQARWVRVERDAASSGGAA
jgi:DtxR family Mn-dependent transcriptional regulator